jgi:hypothetical protein
MQPWIEKANSGSSSGSSSLHFDKTLSHLNHHSSQQQQQQQSSSSSGFRTSSPSSRNMNMSSTQNVSKEYIPLSQQSPYNYLPYNFSPLPTSSDMISLTDGSDVLNFLNSTEYSEHVHGDDLRPDSMSYISHRHQMDTQHGLSEKEKLSQWTAELMATEDIVEYLRTANYTDDIYGIPVIGQWIKEAKEEVDQESTSDHNKKAIARLSMIRNHLVEKASGNIELAAENAFRMNESDWSSTFLDSSI